MFRIGPVLTRKVFLWLNQYETENFCNIIVPPCMCVKLRQVSKLCKFLLSREYDFLKKVPLTIQELVFVSLNSMSLKDIFSCDSSSRSPPDRGSVRGCVGNLVYLWQLFAYVGNFWQLLVSVCLSPYFSYLSPLPPCTLHL